MKKIEEIEKELHDLLEKIFDADDPMDLFGLMPEQRANINKRIKELQEQKEEYYKKAYADNKFDLLQLDKYEEISNILDNNNEFRFKLACFFSNNSFILEDEAKVNEICKFIYKHDFKMESIKELQKLSTHVFEQLSTIKLLNFYGYRHCDHILASDILMSNKDFVSYLEKFVYSTNLTDYYFTNIKFMEIALNEHLDFELILAIGSRNLFEEQFKNNIDLDLLNTIANINNKELQIELLNEIFGPVYDKKHLEVLMKFFAFEEVREQLLDPTSLYYGVLIKNMATTEYTKNYGSIDEIFYFDNYTVFLEADYEAMIHYFDSLVKHHIFFYEGGHIRHVPVLTYIEKATKAANEIERVFNEVYLTEEGISDEDWAKYADYIDQNSIYVFMRTLRDCKDEWLNKEDMEYWDYILQNANKEEEKTLNYQLTDN